MPPSQSLEFQEPLLVGQHFVSTGFAFVASADLPFSRRSKFWKLMLFLFCCCSSNCISWMGTKEKKFVATLPFLFDMLNLRFVWLYFLTKSRVNDHISGIFLVRVELAKSFFPSTWVLVAPVHLRISLKFEKIRCIHELLYFYIFMSMLWYASV